MTTGWVEPKFTRSRVASAGRRIRKGCPTEDDWAVLENWRRSHAYVLNVFQMRLRNVRSRFGGDVQVAQRHKRRPTIVDKLSREPQMQLATMHDIAGCRAVCRDVPDLLRFRGLFLDTRARHVHINAESGRFDYLTTPKESGYRGIHEVFETHLDSPSGSRWNGLKVEIQFRTRAQHAWATAVETIDLLNGARAKFGQASPHLQRFFVVASELIARAHEGRFGPLPDVSEAMLAQEFKRLNRELGVLRRLTNAVSSNPDIPRGRHTILIFHFGTDQGLEVRSFDRIGQAQDAYADLERALGGAADVVLVKADDAGDLRRAFQNYFTDAADFVGLISKAFKRLE